MNRILILLAAGCLATACGHASRSKTQQQTPGMTAEKQETLYGGYTAQRPLTDDERQLFDAVTKGLTGVRHSPESVATQVVAGTNYRFICTATTATRNPEAYQAEVIVFRPLPGRGEPKISGIKRL